MKEFRRLLRTCVKITMWSIYFLVAVVFALETLFKIFNIPENILQSLIGIWVFILPIIIIIGYILPPNFEYYVTIRDNIIIFEFSDDDYRIISTSFNIIKRSRYYILLDDGWARMLIPYNKEVLSFLYKHQGTHS